jgi:Ca2+-binding RTX toxin-like protein
LEPLQATTALRAGGCGRDNDRIWGGSGNDNIYAWHGNNYVSGGEGSDTIYATGNIDANLESTGDYNRLYGCGGNDKFIVRHADATIYEGAGNDNVDAVADAGFCSFQRYTSAGNDYALAVENLGCRQNNHLVLFDSFDSYFFLALKIQNLKSEF